MRLLGVVISLALGLIILRRRDEIKLFFVTIPLFHCKGTTPHFGIPCLSLLCYLYLAKKLHTDEGKTFPFPSYPYAKIAFFPSVTIQYKFQKFQKGTNYQNMMPNICGFILIETQTSTNCQIGVIWKEKVGWKGD